MMEALPAIQLVALVLTTSAVEVCPGAILFASVRLNENPLVLPAAFLSTRTGATVPSTNPVKRDPSERYPIAGVKPVKLVSALRAIAVAEVALLATW